MSRDDHQPDLVAYQKKTDAETTKEFDAELYAKAVDLVVSSGKASISFVQRNFHIGYNRAAKLIEAMEVDGITSPLKPDGTREVLRKPS